MLIGKELNGNNIIADDIDHSDIMVIGGSWGEGGKDIFQLTKKLFARMKQPDVDWDEFKFYKSELIRYDSDLVHLQKEDLPAEFDIVFGDADQNASNDVDDFEQNRNLEHNEPLHGEDEDP